MPAIIGVLLLFLSIGITGNLPFGRPLIKETTKRPEGYFCLDKIPDRPPTLFNIPKPEINGWMEIEGCPGQDCPGGYERANYILVATDVIVPEIWPAPETTRLMKQTNGIPPEYENRVYRPSCNDWCYLCNDLSELDPQCPRSGFLPYGGNFHCDFIWLLQENEPMREVDGELYPDDRECNLEEDPANLQHKCPVFDIYIREGAEIPEVAKCTKERTSLPSSLLSSKMAPLFGGVFAQTESFIDLLGVRWILAHDPDINPKRLVRWDLRTESEGRVLVTDDQGKPMKVVFRGGSYHAYQNLTTKVDLKYGDRYIYLVGSWYDETAQVEKDHVILADEYPPHQYYVFPYLEFRKSTEVIPYGKTLQLGTFTPRVGELRWYWWADESKPAIYLYPKKPTKLRLKLNPAGYLTVSDPPYNPKTGWEILAFPDGTLKPITNYSLPVANYPYLFYEAKLEKIYVSNKGFIVAGGDLVKFFKETLPKLGLNQNETEDFIDYWMTRLNKDQPYYFIHFLDKEQIEALEPLTTDRIDEGGKFVPIKPDTEIRIRAYFKPLDAPIQVKPVTGLPKAPKRKGFTLVEWGGILDTTESGGYDD